MFHKKATTVAVGLALAASLVACSAQAPTTSAGEPDGATEAPSADLGPRIRVISDNDYAGDPDGLAQLAHVLLSPSADVRAVVSSRLATGDPFDPSETTATNGRVKAEELIELMGLDGTVSVYEGSNEALADASTPDGSDGAQAIIDEAMRDDTDAPLFVLVAGGMTNLASAYLEEPRIADRITAIWIGGPEHPGQAEPPPGASAVEYNLNIDITAAQVVFDSPIPLWQVPRNAYRQTLASFAEMKARMHDAGEVGAYLYSTLVDVQALAGSVGLNIGETYVMGDNPVVLLSALQSSFEADPSSSAYEIVSAPAISDDGQYVERPDGRDIRVYTWLDNRLMFEDFYAKLAAAP